MDGGFENLLDEGIISEVISRLKSGKEADVYIVRYGGKVCAAKVYKDRAMRSFKNNSAYKEGRTVRNSRSQRAINRKTTFGQAAAEDAWKAAEADALYKLHAAEVRVPTPVMFLDGVLLMELVLGADGNAAPRIIDTQLTVAEANAAYRDMLTQLVRILACDLIHGDLSPYNVLWGAAGPVIIDFPQIISASHNSSSENFFIRDARNILGHFASIDPSLNARSGDAHEIWRAYVRRELTPDFVPTGRAQPFFPRGRRGGFEGDAHGAARGPMNRGPRPNPVLPSAPHAPSHAAPHAASHSGARTDHRPPPNRGNHTGPNGAGLNGPGPNGQQHARPQSHGTAHPNSRPHAPLPQAPHAPNSRPNMPSNSRGHAGSHSGSHAGHSGSRRQVHVPEVIVRPNRAGAPTTDAAPREHAPAHREHAPIPREHAPREHTPREHAPIPREHAPRDHAPREHAPIPREHAPRDHAPREHAPREHATAPRHQAVPSRDRAPSPSVRTEARGERPAAPRTDRDGNDAKPTHRRRRRRH